MSEMKGKVCVVTGSNSGIGKETALGLAQMGATVVMVVRDRVRGEKARAEIVHRSGNTHGREKRSRVEQSAYIFNPVDVNHEQVRSLAHFNAAYIIPPQNGRSAPCRHLQEVVSIGRPAAGS